MSLIKANNITNVTGGIPTVKSQQLIPTAWVNFNGVGTVAIRDSEGVSSISDLSTGEYRINFTTTMANTNFCLSTNANATASNAGSDTFCDIFTTANCRMNHFEAGTRRDTGIACVTILGGQS